MARSEWSFAIAMSVGGSLAFAARFGAREHCFESLIDANTAEELRKGDFWHGAEAPRRQARDE